MKKKHFIPMILLGILSLFVMCSDSDDGGSTPDPDPTPTPEVTEYILKAEVTNKKGASIDFDNKAKTMSVKIPRYMDKSNVTIKLTLNTGVSMEHPAKEESEYDFTKSVKLWLTVNEKTVMFDVKIQDIVGQESSVGKADIRDLALIYNGGAHRSVVWDEKMFMPYVSIPDEDASRHRWLFDGFLFLEIHNGSRGFASGYMPTPARKTDWVGLIEGYVREGNAMRALNDYIEKIKDKAPDYGKHKIVISLPEPIPWQKDWGEIDGKALDFNKTQDRIDACKWYIDFLIEKFKAAELNNLQLTGFYWLAEEATNSRTIINQIADHIKSKELYFYWIPYFNTDGRDEWRSLGFDKAYLQPNHFFSTSIPDSRIDDACRIAKNLGMSMEMEFDSRATEAEGGWGNRMRAYMDGFDRNGVLDEDDIAYYHGDDGLYKLKNGSTADRVLYKDITEIIAGRQERFYKK